MPIDKKHRGPRHAAVKDRSDALRHPRWLIPVAVAFCATGVLAGVLLSAGIFVSKGNDDTGAAVRVGSLATVGAPTAGPTESAASSPEGEGPTDQQSPTPTEQPETSASPSPTPTPSPLLLPPPEPSAAPTDPPVWTFQSVLSSHCLGLVPDQPVKNANVAQVECADDAGQKWQLTNVEYADEILTASLVNVASNRCLGLVSYLLFYEVVQESCRGDAADQRWQIVDGAKGSVQLVAHGGSCLTVSQLVRRGAAPVLLSSCDGDVDQRWTVS